MIFNNYTGNAFLNNALMTVEALGNLKSVSEINATVLRDLYQGHDLKSLNKRLKSYTMLFTKNGPLHNDAKNGLWIYETLMFQILDNVELDGDKICEISGLRFSTTFEHVFVKALKRVGLSEKEIQKKDVTLNRNWFPLIGGLGSDAQALPQAKFTVQIHPVCIAIMQFLPLSALLYKGGVLLIDSSNFEFAREFVARNVKDVQWRIQATSVSDAIENIKNLSKGNYLLQAIGILEDKGLDESYSDLNLWSFTNSGTGASCEIDRVPNSLIKKLIRLKDDAKVSTELIKILSNSLSYKRFLECLEYNTEWPGLYPGVFGTGKKKVEYEGVTVTFLEAYFKEIDSPQNIAYARYLAFLIDKYKTPSFEKYLSKTDAWKEKTYRIDLYAVLVEAARNGEWSLDHHWAILDAPDQLPVKNHFYHIHRITHFYYQKGAFADQIPEMPADKTKVARVCEWVISLIEKDEKKDSYFIRNFVNNQLYASVGYNELFIRKARYASLTFDKILCAFYDENLVPSWYAINELLRIFYNQKNQRTLDDNDIELDSSWKNDDGFRYWYEKLSDFIVVYEAYYLDKYTNRLTGLKPYGKFLDQIESIPRESTRFVRWLEEIVENVNNHSRSNNNLPERKWISGDLLYNPLGEVSVPFVRFALRFLLIKRYYFLTIKSSETIDL